MQELDDVEKAFQEFITKNGIGLRSLSLYKKGLSIFRMGYETADTERASDFFVAGRLLAKLKNINNEDK